MRKEWFGNVVICAKAQAEYYEEPVKIAENAFFGFRESSPGGRRLSCESGE